MRFPADFGRDIKFPADLGRLSGVFFKLKSAKLEVEKRDVLMDNGEEGASS